MSTPEFDDYLSRFPLRDQQFLVTAQRKLYERSLTSKLGERVLEICSDSRTSRGLLVSAIGAISASFILGSPEMFAGGVCLSSLWQTRDYISYWRTLLTIGF